MQLRLTRQLGPARKEKKGFTLIELLVVIAIIGILAAVVLVSLNNARIRGRDARRLSDLQAVSLALELWNDQNDGIYPTTTGVAGDFNLDQFTDLTTVLVTDDLLAGAPDDPLAAQDYAANVNTLVTPTSYILGADLEQGNQACASDYDGTDVDGVGTECADLETDCAGDDGVADYCICNGPACAP